MSITHLSHDNFASQVLDSGGAVLVDFWASWCGPCKALAPVLEELAGESSKKICKLNVDEEPELASRYGVMSIPTMVLFENGAEKSRLVGLQSKETISSLLGG